MFPVFATTKGQTNWMDIQTDDKSARQRNNLAAFYMYENHVGESWYLQRSMTFSIYL